MSGEDYTGSAWHRSLQQNPHGAVHPEMPCVGCGTPTRRRAIVDVQTTPHSGEVDFLPVTQVWCERCEAQRVRRQWERIAANPDVLPRLRDEARRHLEQELIAAPM